VSLNRGWRAVVCVASGPSFTVEQAALIEGARAEGRVRVIVVNDNYRRLPNADVLYAADHNWWRVHIDNVRFGFAGERWTQYESQRCETAKIREELAQAKSFGCRLIDMKRGIELLPLELDRISCGANSGFQALMLARHFGARRIILVGYDMQRDGGREHWFGPHPKGLSNGDPRQWVKHFEAVAATLAAEGIMVINCSPSTALRGFPRADLSAALSDL
jgi:hypothetical protein